MKRATLVIEIGAAMYVVAWFVKVIDDGSTLADGVLPGWEAFRVALSPIWPYKGVEIEGLVKQVLAVLSAFTNAIVLCILPALYRWRGHPPRRAARVLAFGAAIDAHWMYPLSNVLALRWGYYLWFSSFLVLAASAGLGRGLPPRVAAQARDGRA